MEEPAVEKGGWERTAKDLVSGAAGGIAQVLLGMFSMTSSMRADCFRSPSYLCSLKDKRNDLPVLLYIFK